MACDVNYECLFSVIHQYMCVFNIQNLYTFNVSKDHTKSNATVSLNMNHRARTCIRTIQYECGRLLYMSNAYGEK